MMKRSDVVNQINNLEGQKTKINSQIWALKMINNPEPAFLTGLLNFINRHKNDSNSVNFDKLCNLIRNRLSIQKSESTRKDDKSNDKAQSSKFQSNSRAISRLSKILADTQKRN